MRADVLGQVAAVAGRERDAELEAAACKRRQCAHSYAHATEHGADMAEARLYLAAIELANLLRGGAPCLD